MAERWVVLDLETTGLDPHNDLICEVGAIATDGDLNGWRCFETVVNGDGQAHKLICNPDDFVFNMHKKSGLLQELVSITIPTITTAQVDKDLLAWLTDIAEPKTIVLIGNTIGFDRSFIQHHLPLSWDYLNHRSIDISSLKLLVNTWGADVKATVQMKAHRSISDCEDSLRELSMYKEVLFPWTLK